MAPTLNRSLADLGALLHLVDPTLPIGGFNHSNGLETFVQQGVVSTKPSLEEYVQAQLLQNWVYNDGAYLSLAFEAMATNDFDRLCELDHSLSATKIARESREGSFKLGLRLLKIFIRYEQHPMLSQFQQAIQNKTVQGYFPIVFCDGGASNGAQQSGYSLCVLLQCSSRHHYQWRETHSTQPNGWARYSV